MKIVINNIIPFKGYKCINLFGILFARHELNEVDINHEKIHTAQMKELLFIFFYLWYGFEWIVKLIAYRNSKKAYRDISFEKEAYANEYNLNYLNNREHYAQWQ